ncbi:MAG: hypothetical protein MZW92_67130 [Comamonadaceae bacterium]|nr:hypothetical protein [Comamonadaceae bacterium]
MVAGFDRYFQIVRCFRDEDLRADRQPEFTQIDVEMTLHRPRRLSSTSTKALMRGGLRRSSAARSSGRSARLSYAEAMEKYGSDKPDLRVAAGDARTSPRSPPGLGLARSSRPPSPRAARSRGCSCPAAGALSRKASSTSSATRPSRSGPRGWSGSRSRTAGSRRSRRREADYAGDLGGPGRRRRRPGPRSSRTGRTTALKVLGEIRRTWPVEDAARRDSLAFRWVTDFPLFEWSEEEQRCVSMHHPFTCAPSKRTCTCSRRTPDGVRAKAYDLVLNGTRGRRRLDPDPRHGRPAPHLQGCSASRDEETEAKFGYFLEALSLRRPAPRRHRPRLRPPGHAPGRRGVHPRGHPLSRRRPGAMDLMTGSPSSVDARQLDELGLKIKDA